MIKIQTLPSKDIDCKFEGQTAQLYVEYNSATVGMIKKLREDGNTDKDIRDLLLGNVDIAFRILESEGSIKEVAHAKEKDNIVDYHPGI